MKTNHSPSLIAPFAGLVAVVIFAAIGFFGLNYVASKTLFAGPDDGAATRDKLLAVANAHWGLLMPTPELDQKARHRLIMDMADGLRELRCVLADEEPQLRTLGRRYCARLLHEARSKPDIYLTSSPRARAREQKAWDNVGGEKFQLIPGAGKRAASHTITQADRPEVIDFADIAPPNTNHLSNDG